jgi:mannose-6-phosphate isomerase-like protein (cupin superfamily)
MSLQEGPEDRMLVAKLWGFEEWLVNNDKYCAKLLWILPGFQCSLHYHPVKCETFIAMDGLVHVEYHIDGKLMETILVGHRKDTLTIPPNTPHRFYSMGGNGALLLEVSTTHSDEDVVRLEPSMEMKNHEFLLGTQSING